MQQDDAHKAADQNASVPTPVIVDLGKKSKKAIRRLKRGTGRISAEVDEAIHQVRLRLNDEDQNKQIIPILLIFERKRRRASVSLPPMPFSPLNLFR